MIDQKAFGYRVYAARTEAHLQVGDVAAKCDVSEVFIRHIESGSRIPGLNVFVKLCNALHVSASYLLAGEVSEGIDDPVRSAVEAVSNSSPREASMIVEMLQVAKKHMQDKDIASRA